MKKTEQELQRLKALMRLVNDDHVKQAVKDSAWLELWRCLESSCGKIVNKTISKYYHHDRPSNDLVRDATWEAIIFLVANSKSWDPKRGASPATWAFRKISQITMSIVGVENLTLDIDESKENGAAKKRELETLLLDGSAWGRASNTPYAGDVEVEHPFDQLANLDNPVVSLLLEALAYLVSEGLISDDAATICAERVTGTEYSIISDYFGKTEVAVRKISERTNQHLKKLNLEMPRYADLIKLPMIAAVVNGKASKKEI